MAVDEEAIITQDGEIIGQRKRPGLHFKIPFFQKAHLVQVHHVKTIVFERPDVPEVRIKLFWHVHDALARFKSSQNGVDDKAITATLHEKLWPEVNALKRAEVLAIARVQDSNAYHSNQNLDRVIAALKPHLTVFGIKARLYFEAS